MINMIVAHDKNRVIGKDGKLLWTIPSDMMYFRDLTINNVVVMGRKTYESIGHALCNRVNLVMTRNSFYNAPDCLLCTSASQVILDFYSSYGDTKELFVIGGAEIYKQFLPYAHRIYITKIDAEFEGDTYFPEINMEEWILKIQTYKKDAGYDLTFENYMRK